MPRLRLEILDLTSHEDLTRLQSTLMSCADYWKLMDAYSIDQTMVNEFLAHKPLSLTEKKFVYGFRIGQELIGAVSLIKDEQKILIEHLLIKESYRKCGFGTEAYQIIEKLIKSWLEIKNDTQIFIQTRLHIENTVGASYLIKMGFKKDAKINNPNTLIVTYTKPLK